MSGTVRNTKLKALFREVFEVRFAAWSRKGELNVLIIRLPRDERKVFDGLDGLCLNTRRYQEVFLYGKPRLFSFTFWSEVKLWEWKLWYKRRIRGHDFGQRRILTKASNFPQLASCVFKRLPKLRIPYRIYAPHNVTGKICHKCTSTKWLWRNQVLGVTFYWVEPKGMKNKNETKVKTFFLTNSRISHTLCKTDPSVGSTVDVHGWPRSLLRQDSFLLV